MRIRMLRTRVVQDGTGQTFEAGRVYDLPEDSARHWLVRAVAEVAEEPEPVAAAAEVSVPSQSVPETDARERDTNRPPPITRRGRSRAQ